MNSLSEIIYPKKCASCKKKLSNSSPKNEVICLACWSKIKKNLPPFCHCCGRQIKPIKAKNNNCSKCADRKLLFDRAFSPYKYDGAIKELIHEFKYKNKDYLANFLSKLMSDFIKEYAIPIDTIDSIIPIPLHKIRLREREFNQSCLLGRQIASEFNKPLLGNCLIRARSTKKQSGLTEDKRFLNVQGSFAINNKEKIEGKNILLIDDVLTTGATSSEAALALKNSGANNVFVLTLAN